MTRNSQTTTSVESIRRAPEVPSEPSAPMGRTPQSHERPPRPAPAPAPAVNRSVANPAVSALPTQPQRSTRTAASFDPSSSRQALIATAAYYRAEKRGFQPGHELQDWLAAEREIDGVGTDPI